MPAEDELASAGTCHEFTVAALAVVVIVAIANNRVASDWNANWQTLLGLFIVLTEACLGCGDRDRGLEWTGLGRPVAFAGRFWSYRPRNVGYNTASDMAEVLLFIK